MNINETTAKYDNLLTYQMETLKKMNKLIALSESLLHDVKLRNGGKQNAIN